MSVKTRITENTQSLHNIAADLRILAIDSEFPAGLRFGLLSAAREAEIAGLGLEGLPVCIPEDA